MSMLNQMKIGSVSLLPGQLELVCSSSQLAPPIGLYAASLVSLTDVLIGWRASDCDTPTHIVCSTPLLAPRIGLFTASVVSLKDALIGWSASDYDAPIQLWRIQINTGYTLPSPTWRASPTWRKQKAFPLPGTATLWVFWKSREFPAFFIGRGQSYARRYGTWNSLQPTLLRIQLNTGNTRRRQRDERRQRDVNKRHFLFQLKKQGIPCLFQRPRTVLCSPTWDVKQSKLELCRTRLFHAPTCTTSSGCFMLHRTVHAIWNLYGNPYRNRAEKEEETVTLWGNS